MKIVKTWICATVLSCLAACGGSGGGGTSAPSGGGTATFTIGGSLSGLTAGASVAVLDNGADSLTVSANGTFSFKTPLASGATYAVSIATQPTGETCTLSGSSGTVGSANVTNVAITCAATVAPTFTIGGTVSGLSAASSVALLDNGSDALTVSANGAFTFKTALASAAAYAVTIATQPTGETCTITGGAGTVASVNITSVSIVCIVSGGGGGTGTAFWIPYSAAPTAGTSGGQNAVFIIRSDQLSAAPTLSFITTTANKPVGVALQYSFGAGGLASLSPAVMMYAAIGTDGMVHLYGLKLTDTSTVPTAKQIGTLSLAALADICDSNQAETNLTDPTTLLVALHIAGPSGCGKGGDIYEVVHFSDAVGTAPAVVSISSTQFTALYQGTGALGGLVLLDPVSQNLYFFSGASFTAPVSLQTGVTQSIGLYNAIVKDASLFGSNIFFVKIIKAAGASLYSVNAAGVATHVHDGAVGGAVADDNNLYFTDVSSTTTTTIFQTALSGAGAPLALYSGSYVPDSSGYGLIGSNNSVLVLQNYSGQGGVTPSVTLLTVPVGKTSATAITLGGPYNGSILSAFMTAPTANNTPGDAVFVSIVNPAGGSTSYSSVVLSPAGSVLQPLEANSLYEPLGPSQISSQQFGSVMQIQDITDTNGGYGGGVLFNVAVSSLTKTGIKTTGGTPYAVPSGYIGFFEGFSSDTIAIGGFQSLNTGAPAAGAAVDLSKNIAQQIDLTNSDVTPF
jgi:hypothetical protein